MSFCAQILFNSLIIDSKTNMRGTKENKNEDTENYMQNDLTAENSLFSLWKNTSLYLLYYQRKVKIDKEQNRRLFLLFTSRVRHFIQSGIKLKNKNLHVIYSGCTVMANCFIISVIIQHAFICLYFHGFLIWALNKEKWTCEWIEIIFWDTHVFWLIRNFYLNVLSCVVKAWTWSKIIIQSNFFRRGRHLCHQCTFSWVTHDKWKEIILHSTFVYR